MASGKPRRSTSSRRPHRKPAGPSAPARPRPLYILSDSTGNLARHMLTTFLTQFPPDTFRLHARTFLQSDPRLADALQQIGETPGIVCHAVVSPAHKKRIEDHCRRLKVPCRDLTGGFVEFLAEAAGVRPRDETRLLHSVDEAYHRRIRALEFTLEHDDGLGLETLGQADIVLAGVSRTSKTPTSIFLSQQGYRVANVSLALGVDPPKPLLEMGRGRVVGLWIDPGVLAEIRTRRQVSWRMAGTSYNDIEYVEQEVKWSRRLFARQGWPTLNITNQAIEETAGRIVHVLNLSHHPTTDPAR